LAEKWSLNFKFVMFVACLISAPIMQSNYKNINSILFGLKALNTIEYFVVSGMRN